MDEDVDDHPKVPRSGFQRHAAHVGAALVADVAAMFDPPPGTPPDHPSLTNRQSDGLARLDAFAADNPPSKKRSRLIARLPDRALRFALAVDAPETRRWHAIVARAYARADAVAWCQAEGDEDDRRLVEASEVIDRCVRELEPLRRSLPSTLRRRWHADAERHASWEIDLNEALSILEGTSERVWLAGAGATKSGRPPELARTHLVLRLAAAYAALTGKVPPMDGGNTGGDYDQHGPRKQPSGWHEFVNAALDLTSVRAGTATDSILRKSADMDWDTDLVRDLADGSWFDHHADDGSFCGWPGTGLEAAVGLDVRHPPEDHGKAYSHPKCLYVGRTLRG